MNNGLIVIADCEEDYAFRLAKSCREKSGLGYDIQVFSDQDSLVQYESENLIDILIVTEKFSRCLSGLSNTSQIFVLTDGMYCRTGESYNTVCKYQSAENIIRDIMTRYSDTVPNNDEKMHCNSRPARIISVYSPIRRCGKTLLSLIMASHLNETSSSLLITLDEYSIFSSFPDEENTCNTSRSNLSDLICTFKQTPLNISARLFSCTHYFHGIRYIPPIQFPADFSVMSGSDWCEFLTLIARTGPYENIVVDAGCSVCDVFELLALSDVIYSPIVDDPVSAAKRKLFRNMLEQTKMDDISSKIKEIQLPLPELSSLETESFTKLICGSYGRKVYGMTNED